LLLEFGTFVKSITAEQNVVTIEGDKTEKDEGECLYRGISTQHFKRSSIPGRLRPRQERVIRQRSAEHRTGPGNSQAMKPRRIAINGAVQANVHQIESKAA
jgi:molecular chaperone IbpA